MYPSPKNISVRDMILETCSGRGK